MATFLNPSGNIYSLTDPIPGTQLNPLNFTRYPGRWIYCNYPEVMPWNALGDYDKGNHYLTAVTVYPGEAQVFASYNNQTGYNIRFGIQLYNPTGTAATVTKTYNGFRHSGNYSWTDVFGGVWYDFFNNPGGTQYYLPSGGVAWILNEYVPNNAVFNANVRFGTNGTINCIPYVFTDLSKITGYATCYPWDPAAQAYTGSGDSFFIENSLNLNISELPVYYTTNSCDPGFTNNNEMSWIYNTCAGVFADCNDNIGNWGTQYRMNVVINNDTATQKTVNGYVGTTTELFPALMYYPQTKWTRLVGRQMWHWLVDTIPAGVSRAYSYQYIQGANSYSPTIHRWSAY